MSVLNRPESYEGIAETWHGEWLEHPMEWIEECFRRAHAIITNAPEARNYSWMSIPVEPYDPDIVLGDAIVELKRLRAEIKRYQQPFLALVEKELANARELHPPHHSTHESYAVILEELDECWDEIKLRDPSKLAVLHELVQVAAMCQRAAEDLHLMDA